MELLTVAQMRQAEKQAYDNGLSYEQMMENAGKCATDWILSRSFGHHAVILCGNGNNGGDGAVVAHRLCLAGYSVCVIWLQGAPKTEAASRMANRLSDLSLFQVDYTLDSKAALSALEPCDFVVDALFGIGFHGQLPSAAIEVFSRCKERSLPVIALDIPSGVSADHGVVATGTPLCQHTLSFHSYKYGQVQYPAAEYCGNTVVLDIGLPHQNEHQAFVIDRDFVASLLIRPKGDTHKGTFGKASLLVGSLGMAGAATLAVQGCLRCGVGLCYPVVPQSIYPMVATAAPEAVYRLYEEGASPAEILRQCDDGSALLAGCGLGDTPLTRDLVYELVNSFSGCLVLDADGINALVSHIDEGKKRKAPWIITPHPGEMARLLHTDIATVQKSRVAVAADFAAEHGCVVVLKGAGTVIASPDGRVAINTTGNSGLSKGGSGDLLAGMITSLCAQGISPFEAACVAVWLHGTAADMTAKELSCRSMLPTDLIGRLPRLFLQFEA